VGLETDLSIFPYVDDYDELKKFYAMLFKPGVPVQTRELNQLQSILRKQFERFGDSLFKSGTIIEGCNFTFYDTYPYVKLLDSDYFGSPVLPSDYNGLFVTCETSGLKAYVVNTEDGFESTPPNFKTLFVRYINAGNDLNTHSFSPGDVLTVTDANTSLWAVVANNGGVGFSNSDIVVFTSAIAVNVSSGTFSVSDYVSQGLANLQITAVDSNTLASIGQIILSLKPRDVDLANGSANSQAWTLVSNSSITTGSAVGTVTKLFGTSASASIVTDSSGRIISVNMTNQGNGYLQLPTVRVRSVNNSTGLSSLNLKAQNYKTKLYTANTVDAMGNGYAFAISNGMIYQKGLALSVDPQVIVISKYSQSPDGVSVGFVSEESIVTSNLDASLYDNSYGFNNPNAPGADRLKIDPVLSLINTADANASFLKICSWSEGLPFQQNPTTQYSEIGDEMARRTFEGEGNFVLDQFQVTSRSPSNNALEGNTFSIVVDPGTAYINGYRVQTQRNFVINNKKATDSFFSNNYSISLNYGNWVRIKERGGYFQYNTADTVQLYDTAKTFLTLSSSGAAANLTPQGNQIGTARVRSLVLENGEPGLANTTYKMYLFNISMNSGKNFRDVRAIGYKQGSTALGIADIVTDLDPTTALPFCKLANTEYDSLVFKSGLETIKNAANVSYSYRTLIETTVSNTTGLATISVATDPTASFAAFPGSLTSDEMKALVITPRANLAIQLSGNITVSNTSAVVTGSGTSFITDFAAGDYIYNSTSGAGLIQQITNNTSMVLTKNASASGSGLSYSRFLPAFVPIPFGFRSGLSANVSTNGSVMTLNFNTSNITTGSANLWVGVDVKRVEQAPGTKQAVRDQFVKISTANNEGAELGPWCLGIPDVFRLKKVFIFSNSSVNTSSTEVTNYFYIDSNQNTDYIDLSYLYVDPTSGYSVPDNSWLLVQFDYFHTTQTGYFTSPSYLSSNITTITTTDSLPLANLGSSINSLEVPEMYTAKGDYFDMLNCFDFRPAAANTVAANSTASNAPVNPSSTLSFGNTADPTLDLRFPTPDSFLTANMEYFGARVDSVFVADDGNIFSITGVPAKTRATATTPNQPSNTMKLNDVLVTPYPSVPINPSNNLSEILDLKLASERFANTRAFSKQIVPLISNNYANQPKVYTQSDIGSIDRRLKNVEYVVGLSATETDMVNKIIPSANGDYNRFKFGIFVDNFSTSVSQDTTNPAYSAAILNQRLVPPYYQWGTRYADGFLSSMPYIDYPIIEQDNATYPKPPVAPIIIKEVVTVIVNNPVSAPSYNGTLTAYDAGDPHPSTSSYLSSVQYYGTWHPGNITSEMPVSWNTYGTRIVATAPPYFIARGLKPNTLYKFMVYGSDESQYCYAPGVGGQLVYQGTDLAFSGTVHGTVSPPAASQLVSDASGTLMFKYLPPAGGSIYAFGSVGSPSAAIGAIENLATNWYNQNPNPLTSWYNAANNPALSNGPAVTFQLVAENSSAETQCWLKFGSSFLFPPMGQTTMTMVDAEGPDYSYSTPYIVYG
jgi:hypothetical protein